ncbi:MAG: hypothetical protein LBJ33_23835 [Pseudomonas putida]|jgi:hypothetical protein|nr:hypothetical protein [Pseudomonas putida]
MTSTENFPSTSVDNLIAQQLPAWFINAEPKHLDAYRQALRAQQHVADNLQHLLGRLPAIEDFAASHLEQALLLEGLGHIDPRRAHVEVKETFELASAAEKLYRPSVTYTTRQSLVAAALHNYEAHETQPWLLRKAQLVDAHGRQLSMTFERFAALCRTLDIGGKYQSLLKGILEPKAGRGQPANQARAHVEQMFQDDVRTRMLAALYEGRFKAQLDERDLQRLLPILQDPAQPTPGKGTLTPRQLYLLGTCMVGIIAFEWRPGPNADIDEIIVWIPDDPEKCVRHYDSWNQVYDDLAERLKHQALREFFRRFIKAQDRSRFDTTLSRLLAQTPNDKPLELDGRHLAVEGNVFVHVRKSLIDRIYQDAAYIAVPTDIEDRLSRHKRLQGMLGAGLDLLGLAAFVVPVVGHILLVVSAAQLLDEVYEGYQDWRVGDRQGALDHLFVVAQGLALTGLTAGALQALKRVPLVDSLAPMLLPQGGIRLVQDPHYLPLEESAPVLLERLQGGHFAGILSTDAQILLDATALSTDQLRRLCLEQAAPPARLLDIHERMKLHAEYPDLRGTALDERLATVHPSVSAEQKALTTVFERLSPRGAQEIIEHSSSAQVEHLRTSGRVPLSMAERARWYVRDSRVDQACLGIRLQALASSDSERLALGLIEHLVPWPPSVRVELRAGTSEGAVLYASQNEEATKVFTIVKSEHGYALAGEAHSASRPNAPLLDTLLQCLDDQQKTKLGSARLQVRQLRRALIKAVAEDRRRAAKLIGLAPIGADVKPPRRFADGRLAYTLSGGGESSRQAIRRGIHQIFPTLSELQLDAYLQAVRQRGENLWNHYQMLQRQLTELREALREWQADWQTPLQAIRRRRIADTLRRSWRRKLVDANNEYELTIDGEHSSTLPNLPEGIDYVHVRRLALRNMNLETIDAQFLARFPNLVDLDLSGNQLIQVPIGIENLTQLRRVNLENNQIVLDAEASSRLAQLQHLNTLALSYNPLNGMPDLSGLSHMRDLSLRATGQTDIGQIHQNVTLRAHVDLRDNRISELQREMHGLSLRLRRLNLHENPLNERSAHYLDEARGTAAGARGSAYHAHEVVDAHTRSTWVASRKAPLRAQREAAWDHLIEEPGSGGLFRFLADFAESEDFQTYPRHYRRRVWHILEACEHNEALREQLFREADGPRSCDDRLLLMLNQLEVGVLAHQGLEEVPAARRESRLLHLGAQLHRLDLLDRIASRHVQRLRDAGREVDEIEVRLFYRVQLAEALDLPATPDEMHFASFAKVTTKDLSQAQLGVVAADTTVAMLDALVNRPYWQNYLRECFPERFEAMTAPFHARMEALRETAIAGQERGYEERARALMHELEEAESTLMRTLTTEAWVRSNALP